MDTGSNPEALTQDDVQLLNEVAEALRVELSLTDSADLIESIARRIAASLKVAS